MTSLGRFRHPRLVLVLSAGALVALAGLVLLATETGDTLLGRRVLFVGGILVAYGATGYLAFGVFTRRDDVG